jgi:Xaa-Pro aminopeptidase
MMARRKVDALILRGTENSRYVSEFFHNGGFLGYRPFCVFYFLDPAREPALIVPAIDCHLAMDFTWIDDVRGYAMAEFVTDLDVRFYDDFPTAAKEVIAERNMTGLTVGIESENLGSGFLTVLENLLAGNERIDVGMEMERVRMVKTPEELRRLKKATDITRMAHESFKDSIRPGATDRDLHREAVTRMFKEGADDVSFIAVSAGPLAYAAHQLYPIDYTLKAGDFVKVDMGALVHGYSGDFVRSYFIGDASEKHIEIWRRLNDVQIEVGMWLKPGCTGGEIFQRYLDKISRYLPGYPREFVGHGIGLSPHEPPRMNRANRVELEPDTVVCLESSYYHDGVRLHTEDTFHVKSDSVEHWTEGCPRDLIVEW